MNDPHQLTTQAVLVEGEGLNDNVKPIRLALFDSDGNPFDPTIVPFASEISMAGYVSTAPAAVSDSDTIARAIAKLEARVDALERA